MADALTFRFILDDVSAPGQQGGGYDTSNPFAAQPQQQARDPLAAARDAEEAADALRMIGDKVKTIAEAVKPTAPDPASAQPPPQTRAPTDIYGLAPEDDPGDVI